MSVKIKKEPPAEKRLVKFVKKFKAGRDGSGHMRLMGVLVARKVGNQVRIGWSKCNYSMGDVFNKQFGLDVAVARTEKETWEKLAPHSMKEELQYFSNRAKRYFKQEVHGVW
jgi:hypothetical protein